MAKKEIKDWKQVYQLPLNLDDYGNYAWAKNGTMALMFTDCISKNDREKIITAINKSSDEKIDGEIKVDGCDFYLNGFYIFCVRGWGNLTGIGALNLSEEKALKIQDDFINHVHKALAKNI